MKNVNDIHIWLRQCLCESTTEEININFAWQTLLRYAMLGYYSVECYCFFCWVVPYFGFAVFCVALHSQSNKNIFNLMLLLPWQMHTRTPQRWSQTHKYVRNCVIVFFTISVANDLISCQLQMTTRNTIFHLIFSLSKRRIVFFSYLHIELSRNGPNKIHFNRNMTISFVLTTRGGFTRRITREMCFLVYDIV